MADPVDAVHFANLLDFADPNKAGLAFAFRSTCPSVKRCRMESDICLI
jgi:hypothetical protein